MTISSIVSFISLNNTLYTSKTIIVVGCLSRLPHPCELLLSLPLKLSLQQRSIEVRRSEFKTMKCTQSDVMYGCPAIVDATDAYCIFDFTTDDDERVQIMNAMFVYIVVVDSCSPRLSCRVSSHRVC